MEDGALKMLTREKIEKAAREFGAAAFGVGDLSLFAGEDPRRDPLMVCPKAKCIVGFGIPVPRGLYRTMADGTQFYGYTTLGVKAIDEEYFEIFLFRMASIIEDEGYDACLQRTTPNLKVKGDKSVNPETVGTYELQHAEAVEAGKPPPDVILDFGKAADACGIGIGGKSGRVINAEYGPFMRYAFIITDAPLETNARYGETHGAHCEGCGECAKACDAGCITEDGLDTAKCWEHYGKAPEGAKLPKTQWGYQACHCGRKCDVACHAKLAGNL